MSEITDKKEAFQYLMLLKNRVKEFRTNRFQKKKIFEAEVLTTETYYSGDPDDVNSLTKNSNGNIGLVKVRIIDPNMANESFLEKPNNQAINQDRFNSTLLALHPTVRISRDAGGGDVKVGDIIMVEAEPGDNNYLYNLQMLNMVNVKMHNKIPKDYYEQASLIRSFDDTDVIETVGSFGDTVPASADGKPWVSTVTAITPQGGFATDVHVVYWFAGYGLSNAEGKSWLIDFSSGQGVVPPSNVLLLFAEWFEDPSALIAEANRVVSENKLNVIDYSLGGFSMGGEGVQRFIKQTTDGYNKIVLADPVGAFIAPINFNGKAKELYITYGTKFWFTNREEWDLRTDYPDANALQDVTYTRQQFDRIDTNITEAGGTVVENNDIDHADHLLDGLRKILDF